LGNRGLGNSIDLALCPIGMPRPILVAQDLGLFSAWGCVVPRAVKEGKTGRGVCE